MLEERPEGCDEQEEDANGVRNAPRLAESATEAASVAGMLKQQIGTDQEGNDVGDDGASHVDNCLRGSDDKEDEGYGQLEITWRDHH